MNKQVVLHPDICAVTDAQTSDVHKFTCFKKVLNITFHPNEMPSCMEIEPCKHNSEIHFTCSGIVVKRKFP